MADPFCLPTDPMFENAIRWTGNVATPLRFVTSQGDHGMFAYLQLCKIDDFVIRLSGPQKTYSTHGRWDLDNRCLYCPDGGGMSPADTCENGTPIGNSLGPEDRPELGLRYGIYAITSWQMDNEFEMFQLYLPPGFDSRLVPLNSTQWSTFGDGGYPVIGPGETLVPGSWTSVFSHGRTYIHPEWTAVFSNS